MVDRKGGQGKSRLAFHLMCEFNAIVLEGRLADMCYAYDKQPIAVFDVSRAAADHSEHLYSMAEKLKNGFFMSQKYETQMKVFKPPHVIFFSNTIPDETKWSQDRVRLIDLDRDEDRQRERSPPPANVGEPQW